MSSSHHSSRKERKRKKPSGRKSEEACKDKKCGYGRCPNVAERYSKIGRIGEGTYGVVYKAKDRETGEIVALKRCLPHHEASDGFPITTLREISMLKNHQHPNIVRLKQVAVSDSQSGVFLVFDYCPHGDLAWLVDDYYQNHKRSIFSEAQVKRLMLQLFSALNFLHERKILHRDLKLSNLLYSSNSQLQLADFGLARKQYTNQQLTPKVVSLWYRPPELLLGGLKYDTAIDMWGAGCVMGELLLGKPLWQTKTEVEHIATLFQELGTPTVQQWPDLAKMPLIANGSIEMPLRSSSRCTLWDRFPNLAPVSLLSNLLKWNPHTRWTAKQAMESPYLTVEAPLPTAPEEMPRFQDKRK